MMAIVVLVIKDAFWSALAAMGFALLFNVPRRALVYCIVAGALGHAIRTFFMTQADFSVEVSALIGAVVVGFFAKWCSHRLKMPSMLFSITGVIPMVPGTFAYSTMIGVLELTTAAQSVADEVIVQIIINAIHTGLILAALGAGIVAPVLLFYRTKPVV